MAIRDNLPFIAPGLLSTAAEFISPLRYLVGFLRRHPELPPQETIAFLEEDNFY